jgi:hypothetical protein
MQGQGSDQEATVTGVKTKDYWVHFRVPDGLMPDKQFDGRPAKLQVHRVQPEYGPGQSPSSVPAVVLIHGRTVPGPVVFDLRDPATGGGDLNLSVQVALAKAGIETFAPSLLGYADRRASTRASTIPATRASGRAAEPLHSPRGATAPCSRASTRSTSRANRTRRCSGLIRSAGKGVPTRATSAMHAPTSGYVTSTTSSPPPSKKTKKLW